MKPSSILLALGLGCTVFNVAMADYAEGIAAYDKKDFATAMREFESLAAKGNGKAQHNIGTMYERGEGVTQDFKIAMKWYRLAADQGIAASQYNLGLLFETQGLPQNVPQVVNEGLKAAGIGVPQDYKEALKWYRLAADQGYGPAMNSLGVMYAKGHGVPQDDKEAVKWFRLAAEKMDFQGAFNLALCYKKGQGVASNRTVALALFSLLAAGRSDSRASLPRDELTKSMTAKEVETAQDLTRELRIRGNFLNALDRSVQ